MISEIKRCLSEDKQLVREGCSPTAILTRTIPAALELAEEIQHVAKEVLSKEKEENHETRSFDQQIQAVVASLEKLQVRNVTNAAGLRVLIGDLDREIKTPLKSAFRHFSSSPTLDTIRRDEVYRLLGCFEERVVSRNCRLYRSYSGSLHPNDFSYTVEVVEVGLRQSKIHKIFQKVLKQFRPLASTFETSCEIHVASSQKDNEAAFMIKSNLMDAGVENVRIASIPEVETPDYANQELIEEKFVRGTSAFSFLIYTPSARDELLSYREIDHTIVPLLLSSHPDKKIGKASNFIDIRTADLYFLSILKMLKIVYVLEESNPILAKSVWVCKKFSKIVQRPRKAAQIVLDPAGADEGLELLKGKVISRLRARYQQQKSSGAFVDGDRSSVIESYVELSFVYEEEQREREKKALETPSLSQSIGLYNPLNYLNAASLVQRIGSADLHSSRAVIWGRAGSGKSTFCQYLAQCWAVEDYNSSLRESLSNFQIVIYITMTELTQYDEYCQAKYPNSRGDEHSLCRFLLSVHLSGMNFSDAVLAALALLLRENENKILFILDGLDEKKAFVTEIVDRIRSDLIGMKHFILTARSENSNALQIKNSLHVENVGFRDAEVDEFVRRSFRNDHDMARSLILYIKRHKTIREMSYIPILLEMLCQHWKLRGGNPVEFFSLTQFYTQIVADLFQRYLEALIQEGVTVKCDGEEYRSVTELVGIQPEEVFAFEEVRSFLLLLEELSYQALSEGVSRFKNSSVLGAMHRHFPKVKARAKAFEVLSSKLGFLKGMHASRDPSKQEFYFIHLTFLEYFAARYLNRLVREVSSVTPSGGKKEGRKIFKTRNNTEIVRKQMEDVNFSMAMRFYFGLNPTGIPEDLSDGSTPGEFYSRRGEFSKKQLRLRNHFSSLRVNNEVSCVEEIVANLSRTSKSIRLTGRQPMFSGTIFELTGYHVNVLLKLAMRTDSRGDRSDWKCCISELRGLYYVYEYGLGKEFFEQIRQKNVRAILLAGELRIRTDSCIEMMIAHLSSPEKDIRLAAVYALKWIVPDSPKHLQKLRSLFKSPSEDIRTAARQVLVAIPDPSSES